MTSGKSSEWINKLKIYVLFLKSRLKQNYVLGNRMYVDREKLIIGRLSVAGYSGNNNKYIVHSVEY